MHSMRMVLSAGEIYFTYVYIDNTVSVDRQFLHAPLIVLIRRRRQLNEARDESQYADAVIVTYRKLLIRKRNEVT